MENLFGIDFGEFPHVEQELREEFPNTDPRSLEDDLQRGYSDIINQVRFINGFNREIIPGMRATGILLFPIDPKDISDDTLSFVDMVSKTDPAGNTVERVRFDYKTETF